MIESSYLPTLILLQLLHILYNNSIFDNNKFLNIFSVNVYKTQIICSLNDFNVFKEHFTETFNEHISTNLICTSNNIDNIILIHGAKNRRRIPNLFFTYIKVSMLNQNELLFSVNTDLVLIGFYILEMIIILIMVQNNTLFNSIILFALLLFIINIIIEKKLLYKVETFLNKYVLINQ